jgi:hypothetical protein
VSDFDLQANLSREKLRLYENQSPAAWIFCGRVTRRVRQLAETSNLGYYAASGF